MKAFLKVLALVSLAVPLLGARPLVDIADDVVKAKNDINAAIQAKGGNGSGGITNAAQRIMSIPLPTVDFEQTYIAWSNFVIAAGTVCTNVIETGYQLLPYLQSTGNQYFSLVDVKANQDTFAELKFTDLDISETSMLFGSRYNHLYEMHIYNGGFGFPYYNSWNDNVFPAASNAILTIDANNFYVDGVLKKTVTKITYNNTDYLQLLNSRNNSTYKGAIGKFYYAEIKRSINPYTGTLNNDMLLLPAIAPNGNICVVDVKSNPTRPTAYYSAIAEKWPMQPQPTNQWICAVVNTYSNDVIVSVPYETNIVGTAENKLLIDDATRYIYQKLTQEKW